jgi:hypothetical protein
MEMSTNSSHLVKLSIQWPNQASAQLCCGDRVQTSGGANCALQRATIEAVEAFVRQSEDKEEDAKRHG